VISGLSRASIYFLLAAGITLTLGALNVVNFAHGTFYMFGAYFTTTVVAGQWRDAGYWLAWIVAPALVGIGALVVERLVLTRVYRQGHFAQMLATFSLVLIADDVVRQTFGDAPRSVSTPAPLRGTVHVLGAIVQWYTLATIGVAVVVATLLGWMFLRTRIGLVLRAAVDDSEMLSATGTNLGALRTWVFVASAALAAIAGVVIAPATVVRPGIDVDLLIVAFAVVIIGGIGSITGAIVGALLVAMAESFGTYYVQRGGSVIIFALMVVALAARPNGLLSRAAT
jgi:branched-subunit amino acid ABC-type transport system permease component